MKQIVLAMVFVLLAGAMAVQAQSVPPLVNYQGMLTDAGGNPQTGTKKLEFNLYDAATGGNKVWGPQVFNSVPLVNGMFNVILGTTDANGKSITEAFGGKDRYFGLKVNDGTELTPRQQILSTPFAIQSGVSQTVRGDNLYVDPSSNNVGIGTTSPKAKLEVSGRIKANNVGSVFIRWGNSGCPEETELLYSGFGFNEQYTQGGGGAEAVCVAPGDPGAEGPGSNYGDLLYPLGTGDRSRMPPGITEMREIKCAQCYAEGPSFVVWGTSNCPAGWVPAYTGYGMGAYYSGHGKSDRQCVDNVDFDDSIVNKTYGDIWYGTVLYDNADVEGYEENKYVKCAVCVRK